MFGKKIAAILEEINPKIVSNFHSTHEITVKSDESIVTKTDREVEEILIPKLKEILPDSEIIGEETAPKSPEAVEKCFQSEYLWAVDPIDGTTNFASGIPNFTVSIGLFKRNSDGYVPFSGGISFPALSEIYFTNEDQLLLRKIGQKEDTKVQYSQRPSVSTILLPNHLALELNLDQKNRFVGNIRFMGSSAADYLYVSLGKATATCSIAHIWDIAGGLAIAKTQGIIPKDLATGERITSFSKEDFLYGEANVNWRLKDPIVLCDDQYFSDVQELFR